MKKLLLTIAAVLALAGGAVSLVAVTRQEPKQTTQAVTSQVQQAPKTEVSYKGAEGKNALELLKQSHKVETKSYDGLGELVTTIDGLAADSKHFWAFYVNGQQSQVGAGAYTSKDTDAIAWKLEEIK